MSFGALACHVNEDGCISSCFEKGPMPSSSSLQGGALPNNKKANLDVFKFPENASNGELMEKKHEVVGDFLFHEVSVTDDLYC
eukprot:901173-Amphidinium_carterae.1